MLDHRLFHERLPFVIDNEEPAHWSRLREKDGRIWWRIVRSDMNGNAFHWSYYMAETYIALVGVSQARWEVAQSLRMLRSQIKVSLAAHNEMLLAYSRGVNTWH